MKINILSSWPGLLFFALLLPFTIFQFSDPTHAQIEPNQDNIPGLVSHWPLDQDGSDIAGTNPGFLFNGAEIVKDEQREAVMLCDGENDFMAVGQNYGNLLSFASWFKSEADGSDDDIDDDELLPLIWSGALGTNRDFLIGIIDGRLGYLDPEGELLLSETIVNDGNWHHFVVTRNSVGRVQIFVDGAREVRGSLSGPNLSDNGLVTFCSDLLSGTYHATRMDDIRQYNRVLSPGHVETLYKGTNPIPTATPTATPTETIEPVTPFPTATQTPIHTPSPTATPTALPTETPPFTPTPSSTPLPSATPPPCDLLGTEAETGTLFGDMTIGQGDAGNNFVHAPNIPSGDGFYTLNGSIDHRVDLCVYVDRPGLYRLTASVLAFSPKDNSFYVFVDGLPTDESARWDISISDPADPSGGSSFSFLTETVTSFVPGVGSTQPLLLYLGTGNHTISFRAREDGAMLDRVQLVVELLDDPSRTETVYLPDIRR